MRSRVLTFCVWFASAVLVSPSVSPNHIHLHRTSNVCIPPTRNGRSFLDSHNVDGAYVLRETDSLRLWAISIVQSLPESSDLTPQCNAMQSIDIMKEALTLEHFITNLKAFGCFSSLWIPPEEDDIVLQLANYSLLPPCLLRLLSFDRVKRGFFRTSRFVRKDLGVSTKRKSLAAMY